RYGHMMRKPAEGIHELPKGNKARSGREHGASSIHYIFPSLRKHLAVVACSSRTSYPFPARPNRPKWRSFRMLKVPNHGFSCTARAGGPSRGEPDGSKGVGGKPEA